MRVTVLDTPANVAQAVAARVADALAEKPSLVLGLPTGRTPVAAYAELQAMHAAGRVDFGKASTFNLDEFAGIDSSHPGSFRQFMERTLFSGINLRHEAIHFLNGAAADVEAECRAYDAAIEALGGIDLQILGIGTNGHIGFNEPAATLVSRSHCVTLLGSTRQDNAALFGGNPEHVPENALTMGVGTILKATRIIMVATGAGKARCIDLAVNGPVTTQLPASLLQLHRSVEVLVDHAAAADLKVRSYDRRL